MKKYLLAAVRVLSGLLLGILVLEAVFRSNTTLLPHGIAAPLPVDPPLTDRWYEVRYADADIFYWQAQIVRPPAEDQLEALVHWRTDAFGFPNPAPVPATVDLVVLGRSYSMGAQTAEAWPSLLRDRYGYRVLNLSQTGAGLAEKLDFLERFGLPRNPRYAVIDVLPPIDIAAFRPAAEPSVVRRAVYPFAQAALRRMFGPAGPAGGADYIYPLRLEWTGGGCDCVFYSGYLSPLSLSKEDWSGSCEWDGFRADLTGMVASLRAAGVVPILLFVPTKETVILPLAEDLSGMADALRAAGSYRLSGGALAHSEAGADPAVIGGNADAAADLLLGLSEDLSLCLADPSPAFRQAVREGSDPFMRYDTHWSGWGHELVAEALAGMMESGACR